MAAATCLFVVVNTFKLVMLLAISIKSLVSLSSATTSNLANKENILLLMTMALTAFSFSYLSKTVWLKPTLTVANKRAVNTIFFIFSICFWIYKFLFLLVQIR